MAGAYECMCAKCHFDLAATVQRAPERYFAWKDRRSIVQENLKGARKKYNQHRASLLVKA